MIDMNEDDGDICKGLVCNVTIDCEGTIKFEVVYMYIRRRYAEEYLLLPSRYFGSCTWT
jgi:hypothetical protein